MESAVWAELRSVYFDFDCPADKVCLVKPAFVVVVNIDNGYIVAIIDPYIGSKTAGDFLPVLATATMAVPENGGAAIRFGGTSPIELSDGTLPLHSDGTLPLRVIGYVVLPACAGVGNG